MISYQTEVAHKCKEKNNVEFLKVPMLNIKNKYLSSKIVMPSVLPQDYNQYFLAQIKFHGLPVSVRTSKLTEPYFTFYFSQLNLHKITLKHLDSVCVECLFSP